MSLTTNNTSLQEILAKVNALPEAGGGSGGAVETTTFSFTAVNRIYPYQIVAQTYDNGANSSQLFDNTVDMELSGQIENVINGSLITLYMYAGADYIQYGGLTLSNATLISSQYRSTRYFLAIQINDPNGQGASATFTVAD